MNPQFQWTQELKSCAYANSATGAEQEKKDLNLYEQFWRLSCCHYIILPEASVRTRTVISGLQGRSSSIKLQKQRAYNGTRTRTACVEGRCAIHSHYICKCSFSKFARPPELLGISVGKYKEALGIRKIGEEWITAFFAQGGKGHYTANMRNLVLLEGGVASAVYARILIRRRKKYK